MNFSPKNPAMDQLAEALARAAGPAWIIDIDRGLMVGANSAGSAAWGLSSSSPDAALVLDRAMPALVRLGELANARVPPAEPERLTFWTRRGPLTRRCEIRVLSTSPGARLVLIAATDGEGARQVAAGTGGSAAAPRNTPRGKPRNTGTGLGDAMTSLSAGDAAALREIARRIRREPGHSTGEAEPIEPVRETERRGPRSAQSSMGTFLSQARASARRSEHSMPQTALQPLAIDDGGQQRIHPADTEPVAASPAGQADGAAPGAPDDRAKLAHELRTPLAAIASLAEVMQGEHLGPMPNGRYRDYARSIRESALHALSLVDRLLTNDTGPSSAGELVLAELDLNAEVEACMAALDPLAAKSQARLDAALVTGLPRVIADHQSVQQMLINLVANSLRHGGSGVRVRIGTGYRLAGEVWLEVEDTGPGIDRAVMAASEGSAEGGPKGADRLARTGLGLPLTRELARANGARLELSSEPGRGTLARIIFAPDRAVPV